jgi:hypothetical protein
MDRQFFRYFVLLEKALERELQPELNPGARVRLTLLDDYVSKTNKRRLMFFVCVGPAETATKLYEIGYLLPVPSDSTLYDTGEGTMPADGPTFFEVTVAPGGAAAKAAEDAARLGFLPWSSELRRLNAMKAELGPAVRANPDDKKKKGTLSAVKKVLDFWGSVRSLTHNSLDRAGISFARTSSGRTAPASSDSSSGSTSGSASSPKSFHRSSSRSRRSSVRRHSSAKSHHTRRSSPRTSDPKPRGNSDPRRRKSRSRTH